ncbi:MAG: cystathionine beta-lyase [Pseudomonadota bacterium]
MSKKLPTGADQNEMQPDTILTHSGNNPDSFHGFVNPPVVHASTVLYPDYETMRTRNQKYTYGTRGTPTTEALCELLNELEGAAGTILVPSGLAAITVPLLAFVGSGDHILVLDSCYTPTREFCDDVLARMGVDVEYYDPLIGAGISDLIRHNTSLIFTESPGSNTFEIQDIPAICSAARARDVLVMIDNTWATPLYFKPLEHGVDISIHALTKYPAGHSDLVMGSVSTNEKHWKKLRRHHGIMGCCASPDDTYLTLRGMRSMGVRIREHEKNALEMARWLEDHPAVGQVLHPALPSHPQHDLWKRDFKGATGLFGFTLKTDDIEKAARFYDALNLIGRGYSWAGYESLAVLVNLSDRTIAKGPEDGVLVRLQVGLEDPADLKADLEQAMRAGGFIN